MKRNVKKYDLGETQLTASMALIVTLESELNMAIDAIMFEDETRGIFTLSKSKSADLVLPTFSGKLEEDFSKFQREMLKGFKANKVKKEDQVKKLRENLKGHPLSLVPDTMENVDRAWESLNKVYGDATRVMTAKMNKLRSMGLFPKNGQSFAANKNQVEWLTNLEITLKEILEVGDQSIDMDREAFGGATFKLINRMFPVLIQHELADEVDSEDGRKTFLSIMRYITQLRENRQRVMKHAPDSTDGLRSTGYGTSGGHSGGAGHDGTGGSRGGNWGGGRSWTQPNPSGNVAQVGQRKKSWYLQGLVSAVSYYPPQRDEKCRICTQLDAEGDTVDIYEEHYHSIAVGCPRFAAMTMKEKISIVKRAKFCHFCLDSDVIVKPNAPQNEPHQNCCVVVKKRFYSCLDKNCKLHFWLCDKKEHIKLNNDKFESAKKYWSKKGKVFVNLASVYH